jgi:hypothetical protein
MIERIPSTWRLGIYIFTGVMSPIVAVLTLPEVSILPWWVGVIWAGEVTFATTLAGSNVSKPDKEV